MSTGVMSAAMAAMALCLSCCALAQQDEQRILIERYIEQTESEVDYTDLYDQLERLSVKPLNLNKAGIAELSDIPFITPLQVTAIISHRERYGYLISIYELQAIEGFTPDYIRLILPYIVVSEPLTLKTYSLHNLATNGHNDVITTVSRRLEQSAGYRKNINGNAGYLGSPYRIGLRYRFVFNDKLSFNYSGEKDAGESFFSRSNSLGFDFNSVNLTLNRLGHIHTLVVGDYQAAFGQGLTFGSGLSFGKSSLVLNVRRNQNGLRAFRSFNENGFLRGAGAAVRIGKPLLATVFCSHNHLDAQVDSTGEMVSALQSSGYHRTQAEIAAKNTVTRTIAGANISFDKHRWHIGLTGVHTTWTPALISSGQPYTHFNQSGNNAVNSGADYSLLWGNMMVFGEVSVNDFKYGVSYVNGIIAALDKRVDICFVNRRYAPSYKPVLSYAFGESAGNHNEYGTYMGLSVTPRPGWKLNAYFDTYRSPWLRYRTDAPSRGHDALLELQMVKRKYYTVYLRYRNEQKPLNLPVGTELLRHLALQTRQSCRFHVDRTLSPVLSTSNRLESVWYYSGIATTHGMLVFQDISYSGIRHLKISARLMYFHMEDYNARVYAYEDDVQYAFSVPAFQHRGTRAYLLIRYKLTRQADMWLKISRIAYDDMDTISSGNDLINGNKATDIKWQMRVSF